MSIVEELKWLMDKPKLLEAALRFAGARRLPEVSRRVIVLLMAYRNLEEKGVVKKVAHEKRDILKTLRDIVTGEIDTITRILGVDRGVIEAAYSTYYYFWKHYHYARKAKNWMRGFYSELLKPGKRRGSGR